jgi:NAD(P)-dependent dehydrogenase (short-subunit alcohol dehydrogenase family)
VVVCLGWLGAVPVRVGEPVGATWRVAMRLGKKVALITGGYGGMGRASARLFAKEGAVVFIAGRSEERGDELVREINDGGGTAHFVELEVTDQDQWNAAVADVEKKQGGLHILMNIVGSNAMVMLPEVDIDDWNKVFEINVTATLRGMQTCAPLIKESGGGSIVNIGSLAGITGGFGTAYSSSKWALEGLSRSAAYIYADWGIRCNVIQPGWIETDLTAKMSSNPVMKRLAKKQMNNTVLLRRAGKADEIAYTALFLASDESSYITGTDIVVDGGWFSSAPYLTNERSHHMLELMKAKGEVHDFIQHFR